MDETNRLRTGKRAKQFRAKRLGGEQESGAKRPEPSKLYRQIAIYRGKKRLHRKERELTSGRVSPEKNFGKRLFESCGVPFIILLLNQPTYVIIQNDCIH